MCLGAKLQILFAVKVYHSRSLVKCFEKKQLFLEKMIGSKAHSATNTSTTSTTSTSTSTSTSTATSTATTATTATTTTTTSQNWQNR